MLNCIESLCVCVCVFSFSFSLFSSLYFGLIYLWVNEWSHYTISIFGKSTCKKFLMISTWLICNISQTWWVSQNERIFEYSSHYLGWYHHATILLRRTLSPPLRTMGGVRIERWRPSREKNSLAQEKFEADWKLLPAPPNFEKNIARAFLKAVWLQIPYWIPYSPSRSKIQCICALPLSK
jgi:hypothetical protein